MTWSIELQVPYPPSTNRYLGRRVIPARPGKPAIVIDYLTEHAKAFKAEVKRIAAHAGVKPIAGPVKYDLEIYPHLPLDWRKRAKTDPLWWDMTVQCLDLDNCCKVLLDALNGIAWTDDAWICESRQRRMVPDGESKCILRVKPFERDELPLPKLDVNLGLDLGTTPAHRRELQPKPPAPINEPLPARPF